PPGGLAQLIGRASESELAVNPLTRGRQDRPEQHSKDAARFDEVVKHLIKALGLSGILCELEWRGLVHVLVGPVHQPPNAFEGRLQLELAVLPNRVCDGRARLRCKLCGGFWNDAVAVALQHRE